MTQSKPKTKESIIEILETVLDPELNIDVWTLGLIYDITIISEEQVEILMTYTTPFCPLGPQIQAEIKDALRSIGFTAVDIEVTFEPAWKPSSDLRIILGV